MHIVQSHLMDMPALSFAPCVQVLCSLTFDDLRDMCVPLSLDAYRPPSAKDQCRLTSVDFFLAGLFVCCMGNAAHNATGQPNDAYALLTDKMYPNDPLVLESDGTRRPPPPAGHRDNRYGGKAKAGETFSGVEVENMLEALLYIVENPVQLAVV